MRNNSFRELLAYATDNLKMYNATKDRRSSGFCFLKHLPLPLFRSAEQGGNELLQCGIGVIGWTPLEDSGWKCGQSLHLWECVGFELLGKDFERAHTKPSPSPSVSIFPSLPSYFSAAVFLSWLGTGAKLFFPPSSRHKQELTDLLIYTNTHSFCFPLPCPHTHLAVDWVLILFWTTDWRASIHTLLLGFCDCVFTLLRESRLTARRNALMVRCLSVSQATSLSWPLVICASFRRDIFSGFPSLFWQDCCWAHPVLTVSKSIFSFSFWRCGTTFSWCLHVSEKSRNEWSKTSNLCILFLSILRCLSNVVLLGVYIWLLTWLL